MYCRRCGYPADTTQQRTRCSECGRSAFVKSRLFVLTNERITRMFRVFVFSLVLGAGLWVYLCPVRYWPSFLLSAMLSVPGVSTAIKERAVHVLLDRPILGRTSFNSLANYISSGNDLVSFVKLCAFSQDLKSRNFLRAPPSQLQTMSALCSCSISVQEKILRRAEAMLASQENNQRYAGAALIAVMASCNSHAFDVATAAIHGAGGEKRVLIDGIARAVRKSNEHRVLDLLDYDDSSSVSMLEQMARHFESSEPFCHDVFNAIIDHHFEYAPAIANMLKKHGAPDETSRRFLYISAILPDCNTNIPVVIILLRGSQWVTSAELCDIVQLSKNWQIANEAYMEIARRTVRAVSRSE